MYRHTLLAILLSVFAPFCAPSHVFAKSGQLSEISKDERLSLGRSFLSRIKSKFTNTQAHSQSTHKNDNNILPEGELLILQAYLPGRLILDGIVTGKSQNGDVLISIKDFIDVLEFPITINNESGIAEGWYIRENRNFRMDIAAGTAETDRGAFVFSKNTLVEAGDVLLPIEDIERWFGFNLKLDVSNLDMEITSTQPLPLQERLERRKRDFLKTQRRKPPSLPRIADKPQLFDIPFVDVVTNTRYSREEDRADSSDLRHDVNIRTVGDLAHGTFSTQTQVDNQDRVTNIRANYKQQSLEPNLLGPLKAKRFEVGDLVATRLPLGESSGQDFGVRVTNVDPLRTFTSPTTVISGSSFPGWDVELYRGNQLVSFQTTGDDGFYSFDNVDLFQRDNTFRIVFYGPQGEIREEEIFIPVNRDRLAETGSIYDVSLTLEGKQTYRKNTGAIEDEDEGTPNLSAFYEVPVSDATTVSAGFRSVQEDGVRGNTVFAGASTTLAQTLLNLDTAIDDNSEVATELVARRDFGDHALNNTLAWTSKNFGTPNVAAPDGSGGFEERFRAVGPLPFAIGKRPRYALSVNYARDSDSNSSFLSTAGLNTNWKNFNFNNQINYISNSQLPEDQWSNLTSLSGTYGRNRLRLLSDYAITPNSNLRRVNATYERDFNHDLDLELQAERRIDPDLNEFSAQLNWQAGFARISPSVRYNSENDFFAGLNTRFGLVYDKQKHKLESFDKNVTSNGALSAFVFLDENGDGKQNADEQALENAVVYAVQNGGREKTDQNGIALFTNLRELYPTDVVLDEQSLEDPYWISGFEGVSILPRQGYIAEVTFPVHLAGEIDGTVYADHSDDIVRPLRNIPMHLYNDQGRIEQSVVTDPTGFYLFTRVPPGRYLLLVDENSAKSDNFKRPKPMQIEIGYDGTVIYGKDIHVHADKPDIPSTIITGLEDYKATHPHVDFTAADYDYVLNLGEYNSTLLMSLAWYRLHEHYKTLLTDAELLVLPAQSAINNITKKHILRAGLPHSDLDDAYNRCRSLTLNNISCKVEILPNAMNQELSSL